MNEPVEVWRLPAHEHAAGRRVPTWTAGPDGQLLVVLAEERAPATRHGTSRLVLPCDVELVTVTDGHEERRTLHGVAVQPHHVAPLPGGRTLLACARADERPGGWEHNAVVHGPDGHPAREFTLGDDAHALVTDRAGRLWIAYGEEGVLGDHPVSQQGLQGLDGAGRSVWRPRRSDLPADLLDGIAAATEHRAVWLGWLGMEGRSFLTRIDPSDGTTSTLPLPGRAPVGFAVAGDRAVFLSHPGELVWCRRDGTAWREVRRQRLDLPGEPGPDRAYGRDGVLWFRTGNAWYRVAA